MQRFTLLLLILIISVGIFFRSYKIVERFDFAHDGDLYSWIVKDIVIDHHPRLIGQLTSAPGIFIGSLFYYLLVPFFLLTKMDPIGVTGFGVVIGCLTILSYFFVLTKLFNRASGLIAAFLQAVLIPTIGFDRWIVPTLPTKLWAIWYLYTLIMISRGKFYVLPLLGILIGLIWQVHIALTPLLLGLPVALIIAQKKPNIKQILLFISTLLISSLPLILFEYKHHFMQTFSLIKNLTQASPEKSGFSKILPVLNMISKNTSSLLEPTSIPENLKLPLLVTILISPIVLLKNKLMKKGEFIMLSVWFIAVVFFFSFSHTPISEYYFANLEVIVIVTISLLLSLLVKASRVGLMVVIILFSILLIRNFSYFLLMNPYKVGYIDRKAVVNYILEDSKKNNFPCIGISYITKIGDNVGFRYFFYLNKMHLVHPSLEVPVYNIVIPSEFSKEVTQIYGHMGIIPPTFIPSKEKIDKSCQTPDTNLTDSVFGYVD